MNRLFVLVVVLVLELDRVAWLRGGGGPRGRSGSWSQCMREAKEGSLSMNRNSQTQMTNVEIRRNDEIQMTKPMTAQLRAFEHSGFGFLSSFVIRHSTTYANQVHGLYACEKTNGGSP